MLNYIGKYRVEYERDVNGYAMEGSYIKCKGKGEIYRYSSTLLCLYLPSTQRARNVELELKDKIKSIEYGDFEARIYFNEKYIKDFAEIAGAMTKGKNKKPVKNMRPKIEVEEIKKNKKKYLYKVFLDNKLHKDKLNLLEANKLISALRKQGYTEIYREKVEIS